VGLDGQANATDDRNENRRDKQSEHRNDDEGSPAAGDGADEQDDAAWDNAHEDEDEDEDIEDEDPEEADYRTALQLGGLEEDEFGVVDNRRHDEDDYDEYE
jgi:hypothetical protein